MGEGGASRGLNGVSNSPPVHLHLNADALNISIYNALMSSFVNLISSFI